MPKKIDIQVQESEHELRKLMPKQKNSSNKNQRWIHEQNLSNEFRCGIMKREPRLFLLQFRPFHNKVIRAKVINILPRIS